jgi:hypothetical protein
MVIIEFPIPKNLFKKKESLVGLKQITMDLLTLCTIEFEKIVGFKESWAEADKESFRKDLAQFIVGPTVVDFRRHFETFKKICSRARKVETIKKRGKAIPQRAQKSSKRGANK